MRSLWWSSFYRWRNWALEVLCSLPRVTQLKFKPVSTWVCSLKLWIWHYLVSPGWVDLGMFFLLLGRSWKWAGGLSGWNGLGLITLCWYLTLYSLVAAPVSGPVGKFFFSFLFYISGYPNSHPVSQIFVKRGFVVPASFFWGLQAGKNTS